jgi:dipeptidyl-peptidase-3
LVRIASPCPECTEKLKKSIEELYSLDAAKLSLGWSPENTPCSYEPSDFTEEEQLAIDPICAASNVKIENLKIVRHADKYEVRIASLEIDNAENKIDVYRSKPVFVTIGEYSTFLQNWK